MQAALHDSHTPRGQQIAELEGWWRKQSDEEIQATVVKAVEYGAYDLELVGRIIADTIGWPDYNPAALQELGCYFYVAGKIGRLTSAIREKRLPDPDSWVDLGVYSRMALRIRQAGGWPDGQRD